VQGVFDAGFLFLHLGFVAAADIDDGYSASQLGQAFLQFLAVVVRGCFLDLTADWLTRPWMSVGLSVASTMVVFSLSTTIDLARPRSSKPMDSSLMPRSSVMHLPPVRMAISPSWLAAIAEAGGFDGADVNRSPQFVHHQSREGFPFDVFGNDRSGLPSLATFSRNREQVFEAADFLFVIQHIGVFDLGFHRLRIGDEVRREIALVELHALDDFESGFNGLGFFDCDSAIFADFIHRVGDDFANGGVQLAETGGDLLDLSLSLTFLEIWRVARRPLSTALEMPRWMPIGLAPR